MNGVRDMLKKILGVPSKYIVIDEEERVEIADVGNFDALAQALRIPELHITESRKLGFRYSHNPGMADAWLYELSGENTKDFLKNHRKKYFILEKTI